MISLIFKGCSGYNKSFSGHLVGRVKEYTEEKATQLLRDMPDGFELAGEKVEKKKVEKEIKKEMPVFENKMVDKVDETKQRKNPDIRKLKRREIK